MAAEQGDAIAQAFLFYIYIDGNQGIAQDYSEALKWLLLATDQDLAETQLSLGQTYEEGDNEWEIQKDYVKAYAWYILAAAQGSGEASELKDSLREKMTAEQVGEAQDLAAELREHIESSKSE